MARELVKKHSSSSLGSIKESMLTEAQFQAQHGTGWVLMDGRDVTGSAYAALTGNTTLPDARGQFLRAKNNGRSDGNENPDGDLALGAYQADEFESHNHTWLFRGGGDTGSTPGGGYSTAYTGTTDNTGGNETRPKNLTVNIFIKINEA